LISSSNVLVILFRITMINQSYLHILFEKMQLTYYLKYLFGFSDKMGQNYTTSSYKEL